MPRWQQNAATRSWWRGTVHQDSAGSVCAEGGDDLEMHHSQVDMMPRNCVHNNGYDGINPVGNTVPHL